MSVSVRHSVAASLMLMFSAGAAQAQAQITGLIQSVDSTVAGLHATGAGLAAADPTVSMLYQTAAGPLRYGLPLGNQLLELGASPGYLGLVENLAGGGLGSVTGLTELGLLDVLPVTGTLPSLPALGGLPSGIDVPGLTGLATGALPRITDVALPGLQ